MSKASLRRDLARACKKHGLLIQPAAMTAWLKEYESTDSMAREIDLLLHTLQEALSQKSGSKLITLAVFQEALESVSPGSRKVEREPVTFSKKEGGSTRTSSNKSRSIVSISPTPSWRLVSAFDTPKLVYDAMRQQFRYDTNANKSLMGTAQDLIAMRTQRYSLIKQRVVRHRQKNQEKPLMTIDRLLGSNSSKTNHVEHVLLGMLRSNHSNATGCCLELEDLTASIPLKIVLAEKTRSGSDDEEQQVTQLDPRGIYMDGTTVLAHGKYLENGIFSCTKLEFPPLESPQETKQHLPPLPYSVLDSGMNHGDVHSSMKLFCMGNLELDDSDCIENLKTVAELIQEEDDGSSEGAVLVLFGNFVSNTVKLSSALEEIASVLRDTNLPSKHSVLILPGPQDVLPNGCWPLPALDKRIVPLSLRDMDNVHFCSNPCRLDLKDGRSIMLLQKDLIQESVQNQILSVDSQLSANSKSLSLDHRAFFHMLSQGHLMPASTATTLNPIYWNFDHAMRLVPLPELMVVGLDSDYGEKGLEFRQSGCRVVAQKMVKVTLDGNDEIRVEMGRKILDD